MNEEKYNCGGYALGTYDWFKPYDYDSEDREDIIYERYCDGESRESIRDSLLFDDIDYMLDYFKGQLHQVDPSKVDDSEDLICYRISVIIDEEDDNYPFIHSDFHFKVRRDGEWSEKLGEDLPQNCELRPNEDWFLNSTVIYDSEIIYFILDKQI